MDARCFARWLRSHWKKVALHGGILGGFLLYSLFLAEPLFDRVEALPGEARLVNLRLPAPNGKVDYSIDRLVVTSTTIEVQGWASIEGHGSNDGRTWLVLKSPSKTYVFETSAIYSPVVSEEYQAPDGRLDWSGFITTVPTRKIERGDYLIGLNVSKNGVEALEYSPRAVAWSRDSGRLVAAEVSDLSWLAQPLSAED